ncbi:aliphatic sulfonate ABC transporter permease SsuC [Paenibacillus profundus]|uniref:Aliphatic sulfonate ABC transporter permease SsuC n=1 Tax=Paenibacillus profundus TaxID=1173085 RepID=A0ABS8YJV6_9BACL|nr:MULTISPECIES: aliphatic sulfonate ABC transporter permease SsuC [Paenibacillus]MCE5172173.1 aliphatic sulfonate ABC transporter permease SsuC [Paenibacillus profundus]
MNTSKAPANPNIQSVQSIQTNINFDKSPHPESTLANHIHPPHTRRSASWWRKGGNAFIPWLLPILLLAAWQAASAANMLSSQLLPAPSTVLHTLWTLTLSGELAHHMSVSLTRALVGFVIGGGIGFLFGVLSGSFDWFYRLFDTSIQMIRNIPHLALVPLVIIWLGIDEGAKIFLVALGVMFPIYVNTYHGIRSVDQGVVEMAKVYGLRSASLFRHVILPGALPSIFVGLRYALGVMWLTLIVAETIATDAGVGYLAMNAREFMQTDVIILSIVLYAAFGKAADVIAKLLERRALRWNAAHTS